MQSDITDILVSVARTLQEGELDKTMIRLNKLILWNEVFARTLVQEQPSFRDESKMAFHHLFVAKGSHDPDLQLRRSLARLDSYLNEYRDLER